MTIWAFGREGLAKALKIDDGKREPARQQWVMRDGTIKGYKSESDFDMILASPRQVAGVTYDRDGDVVMEEVSSF